MVKEANQSQSQLAINGILKTYVARFSILFYIYIFIYKLMQLDFQSVLYIYMFLYLYRYFVIFLKQTFSSIYLLYRPFTT